MASRNIPLDEWIAFHQHSYPHEHLPTAHLRKVIADQFEYSRIASLMQHMLFSTGWTLP